MTNPVILRHPKIPSFSHQNIEEDEGATWLPQLFQPETESDESEISHGWEKVIVSDYMPVRRTATRKAFESWLFWRFDSAIRTFCNVVEIEPEKRSGTPVIAGTRFTVAQLLAEVADGRSYEEVCEDFDLPKDEAKEIIYCISTLFDRPLRK